MSRQPKLLAVALLSGLAACSSSTSATDAGYLSWSPNALWLTVPAGGEGSGIVTLTNSGSQPDKVTFSLTGATRDVFTLSSTSLEVDVDAGIGFTVVYTPPSCLDAGNDLANVSFVTDSSDAPTFSVPIVGVCTPAVAVEDGGEDAGIEDAGVDAGVDAGSDAGPADAGPDAGPDAGIDAGFDAGLDAGLDAGFDAGSPDAGPDAGFDAGVDAGFDAGPADAGEDAGPDAG